MRRIQSMPLVTVIVPVFNKEPFIVATLQSILSQDYYNIEIIVIDDGSTDRSVSLISEFRDDRLQLIRQENRGVESARNRGFEACRGRYVIFHDADDLSLSSRISRQVHFLEKHPEISIVGTWARIIDEQGHGLRLKCPPRNDYAVSFLLHFESVMVLSSVMFRRDVLDKHGAFKEGMGPRFVEDYDMWSRCLLEERFANLALPLLKYREVRTGKSRTGGVTLGSNARPMSMSNLQRLNPLMDQDTARLLSLSVYGPMAENAARLRNFHQMWKGLATTSKNLTSKTPARLPTRVAVMGWLAMRFFTRALVHEFKPWRRVKV